MNRPVRFFLAVAAIVGGISCGDSVLPTAPDAPGSIPSVRASESATGPTVTTDKLDYPPGDTVTISGSGWQAGETITLLLTEDPSVHDALEWYVQADDQGNFTDRTFLVEDHHVGVKFTLTATGSSGATAQTTFTDGNVNVKTNAGSMTVSWQLFTTSTNCTTGGGAVTSGVSVGTSNTLLTGATATQSIQVSITALPAGTFFVNWTSGGSTVATQTICITGATGVQTWTANFGTPVSTTTTVTADKTSPQEFGTSIVFTAQVNTTGSGTPAVDAGSVRFIEGGTCAAPTTTLATVGVNTANNTPNPGPKGSARFTTSTLAVGEHTIVACYDGVQAFIASTGSMAFTITDIATTTAVTANKTSPQEFGTSIIFTATVTRTTGGAAVTTGTVAFYDGGNCTTPGTLLQAAAPVNGSGQKTFTTSTLSIAAHTILACYEPGTNFAASSGTMAFTITPIATTTLVTASQTSPQGYGTSIIFTAEVNRTTGGADVLEGDVAFYDGGNCTTPGTPLQVAATVDGTGKVTYTTTTLSVGAHTILACYAGTATYGASSGTLAFTISTIVTTTTVTADKTTPQELGTSIVFTAAVTRTSGGAAVTVGEVRFIEGGNCSSPVTTLQAATAVNGSGQVTYTTSSLTIGGHNIRACYDPATGYADSNGNIVFMISKIATTTTVTADKTSPQAAGTSIVFTAEVNRTTGGADVLEGAVAFYDGGTCTTPGTLLQAAATVDGSGKATLTTSTLSVGVHTILACYVGTSSYQASSGSMSFEIIVIPTTTTLTVTPTTQQYSDKVTLAASIAPAAAPGSVQFQKKVGVGLFTNLGAPVTVVSGVASLDYAVLESSTDAVQFQAVFTSSSVGYGNSTSAAVALTVTKENATITFDATNPAALQVSAPGGVLNAGLLSLKVAVTETSPDLALSTAAAGDLNNAVLAVSLTPIGGGSAVTLSCSSVVTGSGYSQVKTFTCTNSAGLSVNTYEVSAALTDNYFSGSSMDAFTVYDPSLGFATGGGTILLSGDKVNVGFVMRYNKGGTSLQGNLIAIRHFADGTIARMKSNSLGALALTDNGCGVASFTGKATYTHWDGIQYVTTGNNAFTIYSEDCNNPGTGIDKFWMSAAGSLNMPGPVSTNKTPLTGGNIAVPHNPQS